ncbi:MAG TPA: rcc01693 family protein [Methylosinus sp.]
MRRRRLRKPSVAAGCDRSNPPPFPWGRAMAFGFGVLRLSPGAFWSMTPRELAAAAEGVYGRAPSAPSRATLEALMRDFPDGAQS